MIAAMTADAETGIIEMEQEIEQIDSNEKDENISNISQATNEISGINRSPAIIPDDLLPEAYENYNSEDYANQNNSNDGLEDTQNSNQDEEENPNYDEEPYSGDFEATYTE